MLGAISDGPTEPYAIDGLVPALAVRPESAEQAAETLMLAHRQGWAVVPWGGGTHQSLGNRLTRYDLALLTGGLDQVRDESPADLIATFGAGMTLEAVQAHLAKSGQWLPLEAEDPARATIGGLLASGVSGPLRFGHGTARDRVLWLEAIRADGAIVHGGAKVVKNVAGFDTPKVFLGSLGAVGVITAVTFRVDPLPEAEAALVMRFDAPTALAPVLAELATGRLLPSVLAVVRGPVGWGAPYSADGWTLVVGALGPQPTVAWQLEAFAAIVRKAGAVDTAVWGEEARALRRQLMNSRLAGALSLKLSVGPAQVVPLLEALVPLGPLGVFAEAGNGVVRASWETPSEAWRDAAARAIALGGHWVVERCPSAWKGAALDVWGAPRGDHALMRRMKTLLDPTGVLAPGRFFG